MTSQDVHIVNPLLGNLPKNALDVMPSWGGNDMSENKVQVALIRFVDWVSKYSLAYYVIITVGLFVVQFDIFNEKIPRGYLINGMIVIASITITSNISDKVLKRSRKDPKPFLYCPECGDAKMTTSGTWECGRCHKTFGEPKRDNGTVPSTTSPDNDSTK